MPSLVGFDFVVGGGGAIWPPLKGGTLDLEIESTTASGVGRRLQLISIGMID